jgi:hypothetical protein
MSTNKITVGKLETSDEIAEFMRECIRKAVETGEADHYYTLCEMATELLGAINYAEFDDEIDEFVDDLDEA